MIKKTFILSFLLGSFFICNSFIQDNKTSNEKKILVIIDNSIYKLWTKKEYQDSINWSRVKLVNIISDTTAVRKYGKKGVNGAIIIQYKQLFQTNKLMK